MVTDVESLWPKGIVAEPEAQRRPGGGAAGPAGGLGAFPATLLAPERNNSGSRHPLIHLFTPDPHPLFHLFEHQHQKKGYANPECHYQAPADSTLRNGPKFCDFEKRKAD